MLNIKFFILCQTEFFYNNLVVGRQLNPRIGKTLDLKFLLFRIGLIGWVRRVHQLQISNKDLIIIVN